MKYLTASDIKRNINEYQAQYAASHAQEPDSLYDPLIAKAKQILLKQAKNKDIV